MRFATCLALAALSAFARPATAGQGFPEDVLIGSSQDEETVRRAWKATVRVDFKGRSLFEIIEDLSRQGGVDIRTDAAAIRKLLAEPVAQVGSCVTGGHNLHFIRAKYFLGDEEAGKIITDRCTVKAGGGGLEMRMKEPAPLALAVEIIAEGVHRLSVSYRKGHIFISTPRALLRELFVTRTYRLAGTLGSTYTVNYNGKTMNFRLGVEDTVALSLLRGHPTDPNDSEWHAAASPEGPDPTGACKRLRGLKRGADARFDAATRTLVVTSHPFALRHGARHAIEAMGGHPASDGTTKQAAEFVQSRLRELADEGWSKLEPAAREALGRAAQEFKQKPPADVSRKALEAAGIASAVPLLESGKETLPEGVRRAVADLVQSLYAAREIAGVREKAEAYLRAGRAGELERVRSEFWGPDRRREDDAARKRFEGRLAVARRKPEDLKRFLKEHGFPAALAPEKVSYEEALVRNWKVDDARIEKIRILGSKAEVTFSAVVPEGHPGREFALGLRRDGVERPVSSFRLECHEKSWVAAPAGGPLDAIETIAWSRKDAASAGSSTAGKSARKFDDREEAGVSGSASAYAISFGY